MALTTATVVSQSARVQPGNLGRLRAKRVVITFTTGYDSTTGVTLNAKDCELSEIVGIITDGPASTAYTLLASAAIGATGLTRLRISPNLAAVANAAANDLVPDKVRIHVAVADATPITYSISAVLVP